MIDHVPPRPDLPDDIVARHDEVHTELDQARAALDPSVDAVFRRWAFDLTVAGVASLPPSFSAGRTPPLFPPPRAFLSAPREARLDGVAAALRHVDSRIEISHRGLEPSALRPETPFVLHALAEGRTDNPRETNPGMRRHQAVASTVGHVFPPADEAAAAFEQVIAEAIRAEGTACVRAAWLMHATLAVHPFLDGNGRVSRLLYLLVAGEALHAGVDWGAAEMFRARRQELHTIYRTAADGRPGEVTTAAAVCIGASIDGALLMRRRVEALAGIADRLVTRVGVPPDHAAAAVAILVRRVATADELERATASAPEELHTVLASLAEAGLVTRVRLPPSRRTTVAASPAYRVTDAVEEVAVEVGEQARSAREQRPTSP